MNQERSAEESRFESGKKLLLQRRFDDAKTIFEELSKSGDAASIYWLAETERALGQNEEALHHFSQAFANGEAYAAMRCGDAAEALNDIDQAMGWFEKAGLAGIAVGYTALGNHSLKVGNFAEAKSWFLKAFDLDEGLASSFLAELAIKLNNTEEARKWYGVVADDEFRGSNACLALGAMEAEGGNDSEALSWFEKAFQKNFVNGALQIAQIHDRTGHLAEAKKWYRRAASIYSSRERSDAFYRLGELALSEGSIATAVSWWESGAEGNHVGCINQLVAANALLGEQSEVFKWLLRAAGLGDSVSFEKLGTFDLSQGAVSNVFDYGVMLLQHEMIPEAKPILSLCVRAGHPGALYQLGACERSLGHEEVAKTLWEEAVASEGDAEASYELSHLDSLAAEDRRVNLLRAANSDSKRALRELAEDLISDGDVEQALECLARLAYQDDEEAFEEILRLVDGFEVNSADLNFRLGRAAHKVDKEQDARTFWDKAASLGSVDALESLGELLSVDISQSEQVAYLERAAELGSSWAHFELGSAKEAGGDNISAKHHYSLAALAGISWAQYNLGRMLVSEGILEEGLDWLQQASKAGNEEAQYYLGATLLERGDKSEAERWFQEAAEESEYARWELGKFCFEAGDIDGALQWWVDVSGFYNGANGKAAHGWFAHLAGDESRAELFFYEAFPTVLYDSTYAKWIQSDISSLLDLGIGTKEYWDGILQEYVVELPAKN